MNEDQIKHMVNRFLCWTLPKNFNPDAGISYAPPSYADKFPPSGTNLLDATQADAMVRHMLEGIPADQTNARVTATLAAISKQLTSEEGDKDATESEYGLDASEVIEMAHDNMILSARRALNT